MLSAGLFSGCVFAVAWLFVFGITDFVLLLLSCCFLFFLGVYLHLMVC